DGNLWFTMTNSPNCAEIGRVNLSHNPIDITEWPLPAANSYPAGITLGSDGNLWFVEFFGNKIGQIIASGPSTGTITEWPVPTPNRGPIFITTGPDGNLWFTEEYRNLSTGEFGNTIGKFTITTKTFAEIEVPTQHSGPYGITVGPDGGIWFAEVFGNKIGRLDP